MINFWNNKLFILEHLFDLLQRGFNDTLMRLKRAWNRRPKVSQPITLWKAEAKQTEKQVPLCSWSAERLSFIDVWNRASLEDDLSTLKPRTSVFSPEPKDREVSISPPVHAVSAKRVSWDIIELKTGRVNPFAWSKRHNTWGGTIYGVIWVTKAPQLCLKLP